MDTFLQQLINGLVLGSVYALVALGYTMVYGILELINFAHGAAEFGFLHQGNQRRHNHQRQYQNENL